MVVGKNTTRCKVVVNDQIIEQVISFNNLGVEETIDRNIRKKVKHLSVKGKVLGTEKTIRKTKICQ